MNTFDENIASNYGDSRIFSSNFNNAETVPVKTLDHLFYDNIEERKSNLLQPIVETKLSLYTF